MTGPLRWLRGLAEVPGLAPELRWAWLTLTLSALLVGAYVVIAFNLYFDAKLARRRECREALGRLSLVVALCGALGAWFFAADMSWSAWRVYDLVLAGLAAHTWWFAVRMRSLSLLAERLAQTVELERSLNRYREIAELLPHAVWTAGADGRVDFSNRRWVDYAGERTTWLDVVHPDEAAEVARWWEDAARARVPVSREVRLGGWDGHRTFVVSATPIAQGGAVRWIGACADVDDQKRVAAEKERQARQKTFFLNSLSHDLRAPLNIVALNAHLLKMNAQDQAQLDSASLIIENAVAAGELVSKLLECAKSDAEEQTTTEPVPLSPVLHQVARRFSSVAERKGLQLRVIARDDVAAMTDRQKLERVVSNLVDNAIKFTERGGVTIELARQDDGVLIRVADTGIGVPDSDVPYLFDEFFQVENHERDRRKGFGMGLAICRSLARQLGGDVRLAGTGPGGSCFEVGVPGFSPAGRGRQGGEEDACVDPVAAGVCGV